MHFHGYSGPKKMELSRTFGSFALSKITITVKSFSAVTFIFLESWNCPRCICISLSEVMITSRGSFKCSLTLNQFVKKKEKKNPKPLGPSGKEDSDVTLFFNSLGPPRHTNMEVCRCSRTLVILDLFTEIEERIDITWCCQNKETPASRILVQK